MITNRSGLSFLYLDIWSRYGSYILKYQLHEYVLHTLNHIFLVNFVKIIKIGKVFLYQTLSIFNNKQRFWEQMLGIRRNQILPIMLMKHDTVPFESIGNRDVFN